MTLAALSIEPEAAEAVLLRYRSASGLKGELKGSRIDLMERSFIFKLLDQHPWRAVVSVAVKAMRPLSGTDRGDHDFDIYAALLEDAITPLLMESGGCATIVIDDGRYSPAILSQLRQDIAAMVGGYGQASLDLSHRLAGLQLADVIANSFFNRAMPSERQGEMAAIVKPSLDNGRIRLRVLEPEIIPGSA
jgi:hypothetical protein